ncbi:hypothetical protein BV25DRAFT_1903825 [Artomyces pyxidatus]|uniref:Uncharacterized protein n=1 Tax=Artomyces pyxidatus TaxID=48021 RepID=A0ACB8SG51_9AGAM|nr:hypothetical protein BV25DRAFT_1903825 [Artomyces pyxidatus]
MAANSDTFSGHAGGGAINLDDAPFQFRPTISPSPAPERGRTSLLGQSNFLFQPSPEASGIALFGNALSKEQKSFITYSATLSDDIKFESVNTVSPERPAFYLVRSNQGHLDALYQECSRLQQANTTLLAENTALKFSLKELKELSIAMINSRTTSHPHADSRHPADRSGSTALTTRAAPPLLSSRDYPANKFWRKRDWQVAKTANTGITNVAVESKTKGNSRASKGINVNMRYVCNEDGTMVDGFVASGIRKVARSIWKELLDHSLAPLTWSEVSLAAGEHYHAELAHHFPQLRLCEGHWMSGQIATDYYPSWISKPKRKAKVLGLALTQVVPNISESDSDSDTDDESDDGRESSLNQSSRKRMAKSHRNPGPAPKRPKSMSRRSKTTASSEEPEIVPGIATSSSPQVMLLRGIGYHNPLGDLDYTPETTVADTQPGDQSGGTAGHLGGHIDSEEIQQGSAEGVDPEDIQTAKLSDVEPPADSPQQATLPSPSRSPLTTSNPNRLTAVSTEAHQHTAEDAHIRLESEELPSELHAPRRVENMEPQAVATPAAQASGRQPKKTRGTRERVPQNATAEPSEGSSTEPKVTKSRVLRIGRLNHAKNLCAREWKVLHPKGTHAEYDQYWKNLTEDVRAKFMAMETNMVCGALLCLISTTLICSHLSGPVCCTEHRTGGGVKPSGPLSLILLFHGNSSSKHVYGWCRARMTCIERMGTRGRPGSI